MNRPDYVKQAKELLAANGYVVLKEKSYKAAQERQRVAEVRRQCAEEYQQIARSWAVDCLNEERRLRDRCTLLWGLAARHGATEDDLAELNRKTVAAASTSSSDKP